MTDPKGAKAIAVHQPNAWLIGEGIKPVENRSWPYHYRGPLYIHATLSMSRTPLEEIEQKHGIRIDRSALHRGGIVAVVDLVDVVSKHPSKFFEGPLAWVFVNARHVPFVPMSGKQGIINVPQEVLKRIKQGDAKR